MVSKPRNPILNTNHSLAQGLKAAFLFTEGGGTTVHDSCHNLSIATFADANVSWSRVGGQPALQFLTTGRIELDAVAIDSIMQDAGSFVVVLWHDGTTTSGTLFDNRSASNNGFDFRLNNPNLVFTTDVGVSVANAGFVATELAVGYNVVAYSRRQSGLINIYRNGVLRSSTSLVGTASSSATPRIGNNNTSGDPWGSGRYIMAVLMYNRSITPAEAEQLYVDPYQMFRPRMPYSPIVFAEAVPSTVTLTWIDNSDNESGFSIERSATSDVTGFTEIDTVGAGIQTYEDTGLSAGTVHYRIRSFDALGNYSDYSQVATVTVT